MSTIPEPNEQVAGFESLGNLPTIDQAKADISRAAKRVRGIVVESETLVDGLRRSLRQAEEFVAKWQADLKALDALLENPADGFIVLEGDKVPEEPTGGKFPVYYGVAELENGDCPAWTGLEDLIRWAGGTVPGASAAIRRAYEAKDYRSREERDVARRCRVPVEFYFMRSKVRLFAEA